MAAAYTVLVKLYPTQKGALDQAYAKSLGRIPEGAARSARIALGKKVAGEMMGLRAADRATASNL